MPRKAVFICVLSFIAVLLSAVRVLAGEPHPAVCKVHVHRAGQSYPFAVGSGTLVFPSIVVTNHHVIEGGATYWVSFPDGQKSWGKLAKSTDVNDLAVLRLSTPPDPSTITPTGISLRHMEAGERLRVCGWTQGEWWDETGRVESVNRVMDSRGNWLWVATLKAKSRGGVSGGPVFDSDGKLLAVRNATGPHNDYSRTGAIYSTIVSRFLHPFRPQATEGIDGLQQASLPAKRKD